MSTKREVRFTFLASITLLSLEAFTSFPTTHSQFVPSWLSQLFPFDFFTAESTLSFSIPILSHLNSNLPSKVFRFISLSLLLLHSSQIPTFHSLPRSIPSLLIPFFALNYKLSLFLRRLLLVQFARKRDRKAQHCEGALKLSCFPGRIQLQHRYTSNLGRLLYLLFIR